MKNVYIKILIIVGIVLIVAMSAVFVFTYVFRVDSPVITSARKALYLPAIIVDGKWISLAELEENTTSIKSFYENQDFSQFGIRIDFNTVDGQKRLQLQERKMINKLIEDIAIEQMADEWSISISDEAVKTAMERPMAEMGTKEDVESRLNDLYGWSLNDFGKKVVRGQLLREKIGARFEQENTITDDMTKRIQEAKQELDDNRVFADVAKKYSDGVTAVEGGVMGWFMDGQLQDEIGKKIVTMQKGEQTGVIETPLGLHIVQVNDISTVDDKKLVHLSQIVIKKKTFADFLNEKIGMMNVNIFLPQYKWDANKSLIVFSDTGMVKFESDMLEEAKKVQEELLSSKK